jgi:hypothetical protein
MESWGRGTGYREKRETETYLAHCPTILFRSRLQLSNLHYCHIKLRSPLRSVPHTLLPSNFAASFSSFSSYPSHHPPYRTILLLSIILTEPMFFLFSLPIFLTTQYFVLLFGFLFFSIVFLFYCSKGLWKLLLKGLCSKKRPCKSQGLLVLSLLQPWRLSLVPLGHLQGLLKPGTRECQAALEDVLSASRTPSKAS